MTVDGGEALLAAARDLDVDVIFCSSGSEWAPVWEALARQHRDGVHGPRYVDLMHETLAVAMATGYGLATGRPQLVLLHTVPGLLQGAVGIHGALLSGAGMIVATSESISYGETAVDPGSQWYRNLSIVGGPQAVAQPFVKWSSQVGSVSNLYQMVLRASELARRGPAGPVYLNVPVEVLLEPWNPPSIVGRPLALPGSRVSTEPDLQAAARRLIAAERPVLLTESVGRHADGFEALVELAELLAIPVVEPQSAVCSNFPRTHALHRGGNPEPLSADADLIVLACTRAPWYPPSNRPADAEILVIDDVPHRPHVDYQVLGADQYLEGDVGPTLRALVATVKAIGVDEGRVAARRAALAPAPLPAPSGKLDAAAVVDALRDLIDPDAAVVDETITHARMVSQHLQADRPGRYSYVQGGLGQGIGVALGVKLAEPEREVVLTVGDGSFLYNPIVQSLAASKSLGLPVLIVVFNNQKYLSMQLNHLRFYPDGAAVTEQNFLGVDLSDQPPLSELVAPFGMHGTEVTSLDELRPALEAALASVRAGVTALVDVRVVR
ncbi:thiamine pyrophosphate-dependent enzyme [Cryptosporangium aurantiacum]|uniref:Acetolactate synthase-1/2/3 large subunit n=1 Tax=Cryptosporangium aurantiacum TaxID=134849 RepID=A0A1M7TWB2_9ACTN|nr:thiamine pyrophosphate-dependent enzyme [Cryptosporangium aurantiacum]SHN75011.1 acetolactate synthase-1/2/3 large subunit [Cryptosporangium aurantiacum]